MAKLNPNLHIICGKCGNKNMLEFKLKLDGIDTGDTIHPAVFVTCNNCSTLTSLDEEIKDATNWEKLGLTKKY